MKKIVFLLINCLALSAFSSVSFTTNEVTLMDANNNLIAKVTKGTKVKIIEQKANKTLVEIKGWSYEDEPNNEIFYKEGVTVVLASISKSKLKDRKILQSKEDEYDEVWIENSIEGWIESKSLTLEFKKLWENESQLASTRCSACHEAPTAESHFPGEFPSLLDSMAEQAGLSDDEKKLLVNFYQKKNIYKK